MEGAAVPDLKQVAMPLGSRFRWYSRCVCRVVLLLGRVVAGLVSLAIGQLPFDEDAGPGVDRVPRSRRVVIDPVGSHLNRVDWGWMTRMRVLAGERFEGSLIASDDAVVWSPDRRWDREGVRSMSFERGAVERIELLRRRVGTRAVALIRLQSGRKCWLAGPITALHPLGIDAANRGGPTPPER